MRRRVLPLAMALIILAIGTALPNVFDRGLSQRQPGSPPVADVSNVARATSPPLIYGWGGILAVGAVHSGPSNPPSAIFPGEQASNTEVTFAEMKGRGYTGARVSIIDPGNQPDSGTYSSDAWHRTLTIANYFGMYVIGDDHEYNITSSWLPFWQAVIQDTPQSQYPNVLWEAQNEPHDANLTSDFQAFINMDRSLGDTRWIVLGCNDGCSPTGSSPLNAFPIVTDPVDHVFYDFHEYFFYPPHSSEWNVPAAVAFADQKWQGVLHIMNSLHRPFLGTEWGAETGCSACAPDQTVPGSAGYAAETLAYVRELVNLSHQAGVGYTIWNAGDWNDPPAGSTGGLDTFGQLLPLPGHPTGDINGDCKVSIVDLVVVARAFQSVPSSPNWSPAADLNGDGRITILDLVVVASQIGRTC